MTPHLDSKNLPNTRNVCGITHVCKDNQTIVEGGTVLRRVYPAQAYTILVMLVELVTGPSYTRLCISRVLGSAALQARR